MMNKINDKMRSGIFITFSGNCKKALTFYQTCFGGKLHFDTFIKDLQGYAEMPVVIGSLVSDSIIIHGSDLVPTEGRRMGNYLSIYVECKTTAVRQELIDKLTADTSKVFHYPEDEKLIEIKDSFDVSWILGI